MTLDLALGEESYKPLACSPLNMVNREYNMNRQRMLKIYLYHHPLDISN